MTRGAFSSALLSLSLLALLRPEAHVAEAGCSHDIAERGMSLHLAKKQALEHQALQKRQSPTNLQQEEQLTTPTEECTFYSYAPVEDIASTYPAIWEIASIVDGDTEALDAYNAIISDPGFPNTAPKGTPEGNFSTVVYNYTDPDCWWTWSHCDTPKAAGIPADRITCPEPQTWGLSFDDGPNCTDNAFYDFLQENQQTATLYYIGSNVMDWPLQGQHGLANGHEIGVHTWSHRYCTALTNEQFFAELWYTRKAITAILGVTPMTWRPPFGDIDDRIRFIAMKMNLTSVLWTFDTNDWRIENPANPSGLPTASVVANYDTVYSQAAEGQYDNGGLIVLTHELNNATINLAMSEYPTIRSTFKHVMPITSCQNITSPYVEGIYTYPNFEQYISGQNKTSNSTGSDSSASSAAKPTAADGSTSSASQMGTSAAGGLANAAQATKKPTSLSSTSGAAAALPVVGLVPLLLSLIASLVNI